MATVCPQEFVTENEDENEGEPLLRRSHTDFRHGRDVYTTYKQMRCVDADCFQDMFLFARFVGTSVVELYSSCFIYASLYLSNYLQVIYLFWLRRLRLSLYAKLNTRM